MVSLVVMHATLARARAGDEDAFRELTDRHRRELQVHCYRILASVRGGQPFRLVPTRANGQPAFGCYLPDATAAIAPAYGLAVLTLEGDRISTITWFADTSVFPGFGLRRALRTSDTASAGSAARRQRTRTERSQR